MSHFYIVSDLNGFVLDVEGGKTEAGANLIVYAFHGGPNQRFYLNEHGYIVSSHSGLVLSVKDGPYQGRDVVQAPPIANSLHQRWRLHRDGTIRLMGADRTCTDLCLDIKGEDKRSGGRIIVWRHHGRENQRWRVVQEYN